MKHYRGHYCRICGRIRPNERFSGRGHATHICKECQRKPREERDRIDLEYELERYLHQSHISDKNISRLASLAQHANPEIREMAALIRDIGLATPYRRRRFKRLAREHRDLLARYNARFGYMDDAMYEDNWLVIQDDGMEEEDWLAMLDESCIPDEMDEEDTEAMPDRELIDPFADA